ncbi:unnamed protein product [Amoebophrya sp. A120]|nr:unnamed protein product [Amoebophrya sp. A120]|eukprot:GSA120T00007330001.1
MQRMSWLVGPIRFAVYMKYMGFLSAANEEPHLHREDDLIDSAPTLQLYLFVLNVTEDDYLCFDFKLFLLSD